MQSQFAYVCLVGETDPKKQFVKKYVGQAAYEVELTEKEHARKYQPGTAVRVSYFIRQAVEVGRAVPSTWSTAVAVYEDGSLLPDEPRINLSAQKKAAPAITVLPEVPEVVQIQDGSWRAVPEAQFKSGGYVYPYAWLLNGEPISGYFKARSKRELFEAVFDTTNDAVPDGNGGFIDRVSKGEMNQTLEQLYRLTLPVADPAAVIKHIDLIAQREAEIAHAAAELDREPTEEEIVAAGVTHQLLERMPAALLRDRCLADKAFAAGYERLLKAEAAFERKALKEREEEAKAQAAKEARERLRKREAGVI